MIAAIIAIAIWTAALVVWHMHLTDKANDLAAQEAQLLADSNTISQHIATILYHLERTTR